MFLDRHVGGQKERQRLQSQLIIFLRALTPEVFVEAPTTASVFILSSDTAIKARTYLLGGLGMLCTNQITL